MTPLPPLPLTTTDTPDVEQVLAVLEDSDADENDGNSEYFPYEENLLTPQQAKARMILVFMSISGTIDAIFQHFLQRLPNMMTGNTVRMLDSLANRSWNEFAVGLAMLSSYVLGGVSYRCIEIGSRYPEHERNVPLTLTRVAKASLFFLILSDLTALYGPRVWKVSPRWRLPWMSLAFGMVNAAANEAFGVVTSAMTGHWTKVGLGMSEILFLGGEGVMIQTSVRGLSAFVVCALSTFTLIRWLESYHPRIVFHFIPLMGLSIGLGYSTCFYWYANFYEKHVVVHEP